MATTDTWDSPALDQPISADLPAIQRKFQALVKGDPSLVQNPPVGAKRLVEISSGNWQVQQYNGSTWANLGKLQMDVDTVDGYDAAITPQANTIAVRNASGKLEGDITGNAVSADSAVTLSETLGVELGGTGATTSAAARTNLGVPPTSHASSGTAYGLGSNLNYGHVRGDGETTNIVTGEVVVKDVAIGGVVADLASKRGQIGKDYLLPDGGDLNDLRTPGNYGVRGATWSNVPEKAYARVQVINGAIQSSGFVGGLTQLWCTIGREYVHWFYRSFISNTQTWSEWVKFVDATDLATSSTPGIVIPDTINGTTATDSTGRLYVVSAPQVIGYDIVGASARYKDSAILYRGPIGQVISRVAVVRGMCSDESNEAHLFSTDPATNTGGASFVLRTRTDNIKQALINCDLTLNNGNSVVIAANTLETGDLFASMKSSHRGCLLCNGAAVSRITYADLFVLLGTTFGEGDGSTTFNLPDFRDKTLWGANGNLMDILAAGLPNITGGLSIGALCQNASGAITTQSSGVLRSSTNTSNSSGFTFNASISSGIYGNSTTVQPPAIAVNIFIKY